MKNTIILILCAFSLSLSVTSFAEDPEAMTTRILTEAGFTQQQVIQVRSMIDTAQQKGLPADAVTNKIHEGIAKRVAPERIVQAAERVTSRYEYGYALAGKLAENKQQVAQLGTTVADGLAAGLSRKDAEKIVGRLQTRAEELNRAKLQSLAEETMRAARDLSRMGVSSRTTTRTVTAAVDRGFSAREMQTMRTGFEHQGARTNAESLARSYGSSIEQGMDAQALAEQGKDGHGISGSHGNSTG
ncbi:MAG: hypothetical protein L3J49_14845, partial [Desulfobulbaceae bacterium]|nr:hypothetical protein [Desulfobulbaceae bacterium]